MKFSLGPRVGVQQTSQKNYYPDDLYGQLQGSTPRYGLQAGIVGSIQCGHFAIQPAVLYSQKGFRYTQEGLYTFFYDKSTYVVTASTVSNLDYIEVPLNLVYSINREGGFQIIVGLYEATGVGGKTSRRATLDGKPAYGGPIYSDDYGSFRQGLQRYDIGLTGGVGYKYKALQVQAIYGLGAFNVDQQTRRNIAAANYNSPNRSLQLTAAYLFSFNP
ncbi:outer membrane beta-barrel protein [Hymenobacter sp. GOD-10R]|uniref:outer membrane beta-barrel protein n=1 Tax=Hymenobacter sp. GOD-10R TaxID=3093922 RepID=UPI002D79D6D8|nr:outer membrane beta-barrel protein [Hymenobacter sp. GOD-10R]WRQ27127.1 outer membrane beta-barrel protein [Hymenobacter sp. GOD-10R]